MSLNFSENFDGVSAPSLPAGWNFDAAIYSQASKFVSSPNGLYLNDSSNVKKYGTYATSSGDGQSTATISLRARLDATGAEGNTYRAGVAYRGSAATLDNSSTSYYWAYMETVPVSSDKLIFAYVNNGSVTPIYTLNISGTLYGAGWFTITASCSGTSHTFTLQRSSDGYWLNSSGSFVSGSATAISTTNATIASGNYVGIAASGQSQLNRVYMDDFTVLTGGSSGGLLRVPMDGLNLRANLSGGMIG